MNLDWDNNTEGDLAGYTVYRSTNSGGPYTDLAGSLVAISQYTDSSVTNGIKYYYVITATDESDNESTEGLEESATPRIPFRVAWINEIHYENAGTDEGEFVEIAGTAGLNLTGWSLVAYNGEDGLLYETIALSGSIKEQGEGLGTKGFLVPGLQNDSEGLALVDNYGHVHSFISYEGGFTAMDGPAAGMASADIGISESDSTAPGYSLQLMGDGRRYGAFYWGQPSIDTRSRINIHQSFVYLDLEIHRD